MLDPQHVVSGPLDTLGDLATICRTTDEGPQDQHVRRDLDPLELIRCFLVRLP